MLMIFIEIVAIHQMPLPNQKYDMFSRADFRLKNMAKLAKKARLNIMEENTRRVKRDDGSSFDPSLVPCLAGYTLAFIAVVPLPSPNWELS
uniref:Uncharacterized protein n=1 Tax=Meloidogyne incognita TaxID=6306 RepID=A0A914MC03_MELIC